MNWLRHNVVAALLALALAVIVLLALTGHLHWSSSTALSSSPGSSNAETKPRRGEEAAEESKVENGRVILDAEDYKVSDIIAAPVEQGGIEQMLEAPGEVQLPPTQNAQITPPIAGIIRSVNKVTGQNVRAGEALCSIESAELGTARAELQSALSERGVAERAYERWKQLYEKGLRSQTELWTTEAEFTRAKLRVEAAGARLRALGQNAVTDHMDAGALSNRYELRSPITGSVLQQQGSIGQNVESKDVLFTVGDLKSVWVTASVSERDMARLRTGMKAIVMPAQAEGLLEGHVQFIAQQADSQTRTVPVRIIVQNRAKSAGTGQFILTPGMFANVQFVTGKSSPTLTVPLEAVQELNGKHVVFVQTSTTKHRQPSHNSGPESDHNQETGSRHMFQPIEVELGSSDTQRIEILKGLKGGEKVVVKNAYLLKSELEKGKIGDVD
jgi:cobalt-zinc-cadmium efflux system membrane fusion protein